MRTSQACFYAQCVKFLFHAASVMDPQAYKSKLEDIRKLGRRPSSSSSAGIGTSSAPRIPPNPTGYHQPAYKDLKNFLRGTLYLPHHLSVIIRDLAEAGAVITENDAIIALQIVGDAMAHSHLSPIEKSPAEIDAVWDAFPSALKKQSYNLQYHYLQFTTNCFQALSIIEKWFAKAEKARKISAASFDFFPPLRTDFISGLIAEASISMRNSFKFSLFVLEMFVRSRQPNETTTNDILLHCSIPNNAMSALFLTVSTGNELKVVMQIMDAQLQLTEDRRSNSYTSCVHFDEGLMESVLFGCSRAVDYEHRFDVAQAAFRRYKDDCLLKKQQGKEQKVTQLMYESLMYIAADLGQVDVHKNIRLEARELCDGMNTFPTDHKMLSGSTREDPMVTPASISTVEHSTHLIALVRANYLADAMLALRVMLANSIPLPIYAFQVVIEGIGGVSRTKSDVLAATRQTGSKVKGRSADMMASYTHLPSQYHNGFQMLSDVLKLMKDFGIDLLRPSSFTEYEQNSRSVPRMPRGSYFTLVKSVIDSYTQLGTQGVTHLQSFFISNPAQYSVDAFCQLASQSAHFEEIFRVEDVLPSVVMLFLLRCVAGKTISRTREMANCPVFSIPSHELRIIDKLNTVVFERVWGSLTANNQLLPGEERRKHEIAFYRSIQKIVPKSFAFPNHGVLEEIYRITDPTVLVPIGFGLAEDPTHSLRSRETLREYLKIAENPRRTVIVPFSLAAYLHFTLTEHESDFTNEQGLSRETFTETFRTSDLFTTAHHVWYVTLEQEIIIRSYSKRRKGAIDYNPSQSDIGQICNLCTVHFLEGLSELLRACSGGRPMPFVIHTGKSDPSKTSYLERKLHRYLDVISIA